MNWRWAFGLGAVVMMLMGCQTTHKTAMGGYDVYGRPRPLVAVVPVIDSSHSDLSWDVSEELTALVRERLAEKGDLRLSSSDSVALTLQHIDASTLFAGDLKSASAFHGYDFVVAMELLDHKEIPYTGQKVRPVYPSSEQVGSVIMMTVRLKVIDMRGEQPFVVLQEMLPSNHMVPKRLLSLDYDNIDIYSEAYRASPLGVSHSRLARDITWRIENYIQVAGG